MSHKAHHDASTPASVVSQVARSYGIPPKVALAIAEVESGLNPHAVGDNGTSFGLYQLHEGGELGSHTEQWAFDPYNNARTALSRVASERKLHPSWSWGQVAAAAQRPADQAAYARAVDGKLKGPLHLPPAANAAYTGSGGTTGSVIGWIEGNVVILVVILVIVLVVKHK